MNGYSNVHNLDEPHEPIPNLSISTDGSDGGHFRTLPVGGLMGCVCSIIDRKEDLCLALLTLCATGQFSGSVLVISAELRVLVQLVLP